MRKRLLAFLIMALFSKSHAFNEHFLAYCKHTNHAELNIVDGKFQDAIISYDSAFVLYPQPLAKDIHNAIICAEKIKNEQKIKEYLILMLETKSLKPTYYKERGRRKYLTKEEEEEIKKKYVDKIKSEAYLFLQELIKEDQAIRTWENYTQQYHLIQKTDSLTYVKYVAYFGDYFPGEELTLDYPSSQGINLVLFRHWTANKGLGFEAVVRSQKMVEDLKFLNYDYAYHYDAKLENLINRFGYGLVLKMEYASKKVRKMLNVKERISPIQFSPENSIDINERRAKIGLETYDEYVKKSDFFLKSKAYYFPIGYQIMTLN